MPAEVISLLSSSPEAPPTSNIVASRIARAPPSRALSYGDIDSTTESSSRGAKRRMPDESTIATVRANSGYTRQDDNFLFLSDDFDTTGDLDGNVAKKSRASTSGRRADGSFKRTKSAAYDSNSLRPLSPTGLKRWNTVADPIEYSSSPSGFATRKTSSREDILPDPFQSPPSKHTKIANRSVSNLSSDPFRSSPQKAPSHYRPSTTIRSLSRQSPYNDNLDSPGSGRLSKAPIIIDLSDEELGSSLGKSQATKSKQNGAWDPISSSMPETKPARRGSLTDSDSDLPDLGDIDFSKAKSRRHFYSPSPSPPRKTSKTATKGSTPKKAAQLKKTEEEKEQEKRKKAEAREAEKERKRIEKEQAKEQKAIEKQKEKALAEVNKLKTDRKVAVPEMIVDLPNTLSAGIKAQIEKLLRDMDVQFEYWDSHVANTVKWRRKVSSKYNDELGHWEPVPMRIKPEEHVMVLLEAAEFVKLVRGPEGQDLEAHVLNMQTSFPNNTLIYLIEGLTPWMRKNRNILNRQFVSAVRAQADPGSSQAPSRRRNNNAQQEYIDEDIIEDALLSLQVVHGALIHHTNIQVETAEWVAVFTQHISTIPYRRARDAAADAGFCMEAGQVRTGEDARDTYVRMLQEITRVTAPIAYGVAAKYGTVAELVRGLERDGPLALENCRKCANSNGAFTDRVIGQAVSKRIYKIFTSRDPGSMDV
ncbi:hypothetical protein F5Y04DRAFT_246104 [Hypomontagnella monticulosa]|nr:hypothetical protein F5Y04DRAFT_246104 [Hypomontagnella monticulosa]